MGCIYEPIVVVLNPANRCHQLNWQGLLAEKVQWSTNYLLSNGKHLAQIDLLSLSLSIYILYIYIYTHMSDKSEYRNAESVKDHTFVFLISNE